MRQRQIQIVWFKRDLRVVDHAPLAEAARCGPVLPLFVFEPDYWRQPDVSGRQLDFLCESLTDLREALAALGQPLVLRSGAIEAVLEDLRQSQPLDALWSHEETGNAWTFARDLRVRAWCAAHRIAWHERRQTGVIRRLASRDGWARRWDRQMRHEPIPVPRRVMPVMGIDPGDFILPALAADHCPGRQPGGRAAAVATLRSFLAERGRPYRRSMSSPREGAVHCSRLSPHLAWGTLSLREALQAAETRLRALAPEEPGEWRGSLTSFTGRLRWHCHFIQKLESEPEIEFRCFHRSYEGMRDEHPQRLAAWAEGRTGWPFVDACMRMLRATGWLNFRMRAMLVSVASYQLWLDWRSTGLHLARLFTDYEPGIHWPQTQMQSGTTGINTIRIYNPVKQGLDQDPDGCFVRRWCPELAAVPDRWLQTPWQMSASDQSEARCVVGRDYPAPIVDLAAAARHAREAVWAVRRDKGFATVADVIQARHGSRRSGLPPSIERRASGRGLPNRQYGLDL